MARSNDLTAADKAASDACTRSGAFALLLVVLLFVLIPYWVERRYDLALARYIGTRQNLALYVTTLDMDPLWLKYKAAQPAAESTSIAQLLKAQVDVSPAPAEAASTVPKTAAPIGAPKQNRKRLSGPKQPEPPTNLSITVISPPRKLNWVPAIAGFLRDLNDSEMLTRSREVSHFYDVSVIKWLQMRNSLVYANAMAGPCYTSGKELEVPHKPPTNPYYVPSLYEDDLLQCLTISDVRRLAQFELPTIVNPTEGVWPTSREIQISPGGLPRDPYLATLAANTLLLFVLIYFGSFVREAASSQDFPVQGTLFSAFAKSRLGLFALFLALWSPAIASIAVAVVARMWTLGFSSAAVTLAVLFAGFPLVRNSYFGELSPSGLVRLFNRGKAQEAEGLTPGVDRGDGAKPLA
jgi:hypothetical protein